MSEDNSPISAGQARVKSQGKTRRVLCHVEDINGLVLNYPDGFGHAYTRMLAAMNVSHSGCWESTTCISERGYSFISVTISPYSQVRIYRHQISYFLHNGPLERGMQIDHLCRNKKCFNPDHLDQVLPRTNYLRGNGPSAINRRKTHCIRGHAFEEGNIYWQRNGKKQCRKCIKIRESRRCRKKNERIVPNTVLSTK